ncbi:PREDICTED: tumor suppressor candidate 2 [Haliaeetus leucocephalus]|uniref:tumor suppressor candidate 2 n=1 Tax=Haliaeetus leucocephalus TaxID=52644 RepID=UPI00053CE379|nr:PREDICTED: tumor suppressor candidate 2 [Haliaeetus leucocephalus]
MTAPAASHPRQRLSRQRVVVAGLAGLVVPACPGSVPCSGRRKPAAVGRLLPSQLPFPLGSSMYYDEDGDLAHEFYEETIVTKNGRKRAKLKRIHKNLIPQGIVKLEHPRIHVDFPVIICEV